MNRGERLRPKMARGPKHKAAIRSMIENEKRGEFLLVLGCNAICTLYSRDWGRRSIMNRTGDG